MTSESDGLLRWVAVPSQIHNVRHGFAVTDLDYSVRLRLAVARVGEMDLADGGTLRSKPWGRRSRPMAVLAEKIPEVIRSCIETYFKQNWITTAAFERLLEQAIRDYDHRAINELNQNGHDAHSSGERDGRILVHLDEAEGV